MEPWKFIKTEQVETKLDKLILKEDETPIAWAYTEKDAKAISALPEMINALKTVEDYIKYPHTHKGTTRIRKAVEHALKKAL